MHFHLVLWFARRDANDHPHFSGRDQRLLLDFLDHLFLATKPYERPTTHATLVVYQER